MLQSKDNAKNESDPVFAAGRSGEFGWRLAWLELAPPLAAILAFGAGIALLSSAAQPAIPDRLQALLENWPLAAIELSHFLASIIGVLLLLVGGGLWRRLDGAHTLAVVLLVLGASFSLLKALDFEEATLLALTAGILILSRAAFFRHSQLTVGLFVGPWMIGVIATLGLIIWLMLSAYQHVDYRDDLWWTMLRDQDISRSMRALGGAVIVALLAFVWLALHPYRPAPTSQKVTDDFAKAQAVLDRAKLAHGEANLMFTGDKRFVFTPSGNSFVMYRPRGALWIAMGDPVGLPSERLEALACFHAAADAASTSPVIYAASADLLPAVIDLGYAVRKIGETAVVTLANFTLDGPARAKLRQAKNRLAREGWRFEVFSPGDPVDWAALKHVSDAWLARHKGSEKAFSLGRFERAYLERFPIAVALKDGGDPVAFASLWPTPDKGDIAVDLMRFSDEAPNGIMDFLFVGVMEWSKAEGYARLDIGMTPLAGLSAMRYASIFSKIGASIYEAGEAFYGFRGLRTYKAKFAPDWKPVFIAAPGHVSLPVALAGEALLTSGGWLGILRK